MNESLENIKFSLYNSKEIADVKHNPVVKAMLSCLKRIPVLGELIDDTLDEALLKFQESKRNELLDIILSDSEHITTDMVNDVEFIMSFRKTIEAIDRLASNDKVLYFGNLLKNGYLGKDKIQLDRFEEYFYAINSLSRRQLFLLALLYSYRKKNISCEDEKGIELKRWELYREEACNICSLTEEELVSVLKSAEKSGLCKELVGSMYGYKGGRFEATVMLGDFVTFITSKNSSIQKEY